MYTAESNAELLDFIERGYKTLGEYDLVSGLIRLLLWPAANEAKKNSRSELLGESAITGEWVGTVCHICNTEA